MPILKFKKTKKNQKKPKKNQCQFTDFGVATGFFWFFLGEHPPKISTSILQLMKNNKHDITTAPQ